MSLDGIPSSSILSDLAFQRWHKSIPKVSAKDDPVEWTQKWERFLETPWPPDLSQTHLRFAHRDIDELLVSCYRGSYRDVCNIQHQLSVTLANISAHTDFEETWTEWSSVQRRAFLQQAIVRGVAASSQYVDIRPYCREVSVAFLEDKLLDVLKHCMQDDLLEISKTPIIYPVEYMKDIDDKALPLGHGLMVRYTRLRQTQLLCTVLGEALSLFLGDPAIKGGTLKGDVKIPNATRAQKKVYKALPAACEHCRKPEKDPKNGKFKVCAKCKGIGRNMPYCTPECAKADWKRHKIICGQPLTEETAAFTAVVVDAATGQGQAPTIVPAFTPPLRASRVCSIRPVANGYKRSAALARQVLLLQQNPAIDYFLTLPRRTDNLVSITLPDDAVCVRFCRAGDELMSTGDMASLGVVVEVLLQCMRKLINQGQYCEEYLVAQIKKEYDVEMTSSG
ncbi:hypothetical protein C8R43DRAFT_1004465 [Mycena crocata]|nr:hypothetical protein C8R43DRAFT_1004465 [Mycena crocata]